MASNGAGGRAGAGARRGGGGEESEIDSRPLVVERKRLYFNVRENSRGRFLKIAEVNRQRRSTVIIPQSGWVQMRNMLNDFIAAAEAAGSTSTGTAGNGRAKASEPVAPSTQLWVESIPYTTTSEELRKVFEAYGTIENCQVLTYKNGGPRGVAIVKFSAQWEADQAIEALQGSTVGDRAIRVRYDRFPDAPSAASDSKDAEADSGIPLTVRSVDGTEVSLTVMPISTVGDVLTAVQGVEALGLPEGCSLRFNDTWLDPSVAVSEYGITANAVLQLAVRE